MIVERTERAMRERIAALPDGDYRYGCEIDGFDAGAHRGDGAGARRRADVDYAGSSPRSAMASTSP